MKHIIVLGYKIPITYKLAGDIDGQYHPDTRKIEINPNSTSEIGAIIFHETLHAILDISAANEGLSEEVEERIVRAIENGMWPLLKNMVDK